MLARSWTGRASPENAAGYVEYFKKSVFPELRRIEGHRGAYVLQRSLGDTVEIVVLTLWDSMAAVKSFAGDDPASAVVEDEAKAFLTEFDSGVKHFEVVFETAIER